MDGSARKTSSYEPDFTGIAGAPPAFVWVRALAQSDLSATVFAGSAVFGTKPSCRHLRHQDSKSVGAELTAATRSLPLPVLTPWAAVPNSPRQYSLTMS